MNDKNFFNAFLAELKSKWFIIIILAAVLGGGLMFEKRAGLSHTISVSTSAYAQKLVKLVLNDTSNAYNIQTSGLFTNSPLIKYAFLKESEKNFDYSKFNINFNLLSNENKFAWLDKRLITSTYYPNLFLISFEVKDEDAKDMEYTNNNMEKFLDEYIAFADIELQKAGIGQIEVIDKVFLPAEGTVLPAKTVMFKYGIVGAALGVAIALLIIAGLSMRKMKDD